MKIKVIGFVILTGIIVIASSLGNKSKQLRLNHIGSVDKEIQEEIQEETTTQQLEKTIYDIEADIMEDYNNMVRADNEPFVLVDFIDKTIKEVAEDNAIKMIVELERIQTEYIEKYVNELFAEGYQMDLLNLAGTIESEDLFFDQRNIEYIKNDDLKELMERLSVGKYKLINNEGAFYPIIDYEKMKSYNKYLSQEIEDYIDIKAIDSNIPLILDAEIKVSFDELAERLIQIESYIKKYPVGIKYKEILEIYDMYLGIYLNGSDNSPIYDYDTFEIRDDVLSSYKKIKSKGNTKISEIIGEYMHLIEKDDKKVDKDILLNGVRFKNQIMDELR